MLVGHLPVLSSFSTWISLSFFFWGGSFQRCGKRKRERIENLESPLGSTLRDFVMRKGKRSDKKLFLVSFPLAFIYSPPSFSPLAWACQGGVGCIYFFIFSQREGGKTKTWKGKRRQGRRRQNAEEKRLYHDQHFLNFDRRIYTRALSQYWGKFQKQQKKEKNLSSTPFLPQYVRPITGCLPSPANHQFPLAACITQGRRLQRAEGGRLGACEWVGGEGKTRAV